MAAPAFAQESYSYHRYNRHHRLHRLLRVLTVICQLFCVAPILSAHLQQNKLLLLRRMHHLLALLILLQIFVLSWCYIKRTDTTPSIIENAFYFGEIIANNFLSTFIVSGTFCYALHYRNVPLKFLHILQTLNRLEAQQRSIKWNLLAVLYKEICLYCLGVLLLTTLHIGLNFALVEYGFFELLRNFGAHILPNFLLSLKLGQYCLCLRFASLLYKRLNEAIQRRVKYVDLSSSTRFELSTVRASLISSDKYYVTEIAWYKREFSQQRLDVYNDCEFMEFIRRLYMDLDMLLVQVTNVFSFILLLNFFDSIITLSMYFFEIYKNFDCPELGAILWNAQHIARISLILIANNVIVEEKCRTALVLNELYITSREMEHSINRFLLQLMARKPSSTVYGIIELDLLLIMGIAGAVSNFVMFLIQVDLSNNSFEIASINQMTANNINGSEQ